MLPSQLTSRDAVHDQSDRPCRTLRRTRPDPGSNDSVRRVPAGVGQRRAAWHGDRAPAGSGPVSRTLRLPCGGWCRLLQMRHGYAPVKSVRAVRDRGSATSGSCRLCGSGRGSARFGLMR